MNQMKNPSEIRKEPEMVAALAELSKSHDRMQEAVDRIAIMLEPIMGIHPPETPKGATEGRQGMSQITSTLFGAASFMNEQAAKMETLIRRLVV
jgi:hypothetical protein